jgi:hypothetical protein
MARAQGGVERRHLGEEGQGRRRLVHAPEQRLETGVEHGLGFVAGQADVGSGQRLPQDPEVAFLLLGRQVWAVVGEPGGRLYRAPGGLVAGHG